MKLHMPRKIGISVALRQDQVSWLEEQEGSISENVREAVDELKDGEGGE